MADLKEFEQKAEELRVLGMKISVGQDTVYEHYWDEDCRRNIYSEEFRGSVCPSPADIHPHRSDTIPCLSASQDPPHPKSRLSDIS